ncbi:MAG: hypothetical protein HPAVJP_1230 [Candidatus Hepatoplasma vulgare]|nr:MAG: hypothetical protein HPAVJP_1230 [Candidatus Hepatoplasma sp.]
MGWILPSGMIIPSVITFSSLIIIMVMFGGSILEMRKTSLIKSLSLTNVSKINYFVVNITMATIFTFISVIIILFFSWVLTDIGFLVDDFSAFGRPELVAAVDWKNVEWGSFVYGILMTVAISFSLAFLVISFTKSSFSLYLFIFVYSFFLFSMGDLIIPKFVYEGTNYKFINDLYWAMPHYYTNKIISGSLTTTNALSTQFQNEDLILSDLHALEAWINSGFPVTGTGPLNTAIDWSQVNGYENGYDFNYDFFENSILINWASDWENQETFLTLVYTFDSLLTFGDEYELWVFGSFRSMMICFFPLFLFFLFTYISTKSFSWAKR